MDFGARDRLQLATAERSHSLGMLGIYDLMRERFLALALDQPYTVAEHGWTEQDAGEAVDTLLSGFAVNRAARRDFRAWYATQGEELAVWFDLHGDGDWSIMVTGADQTSADNLLERFKAALPPGLGPVDGTVPVTFHVLGPMGPISYTRRLAAGSWTDVDDNYPTAVRDQLELLMASTAPAAGGRLVILHGVPGTGKTHTVRALAQAWAGWADVDYVIDSDNFFGEASYMVATMVMGGGYGDDGSRWRLVVLEDSGEFLTKQAGEKPGGGLGRLLNLADGLVGQGLQLIILMSTNEPIEALHPALTRPGRCMASIEFPAFDVDEANLWLSARRARGRVSEPATLAELYQLTR